MNIEPQIWNILKWQTIIVMAKECLHKGNQLLLFLLPRKQGKPANILMKYTVHICYSEHETSVVKHFDVQCNYCYGKEMSAQTKPLPPVPLPKKAW